MNIFVTYSCPVLSAQALDNKRVIKMILETAQMLSTAMHIVGAPGTVYKATHANHPCSVWAHETQGNYQWMLDHFIALLDEYGYRYNKVHACENMYQDFLSALPYMPAGERTPFANCSPHKNMEVHAAYRKTMDEKWATDKYPPAWHGRLRPIW